MSNILKIFFDLILYFVIAGLGYFITYNLARTQKLSIADAIAIVAVVVAILLAGNKDSISMIAIITVLGAVFGAGTFGLGRLIQKNPLQSFPVWIHFISILILISVTSLLLFSNSQNGENEIILAERDTWRQEGVELRLERFSKASDNSLFFEWNLQNNSNQTIAITLTPKNFSAVDNLGNKLVVLGIGAQYSSPSLELKFVLEPTEKANFWSAVQYDIFYSSAREVTIIVSDISKIVEAKWRVHVGFN